MLHRLKRHPFPVEAHFDFTLALTFAVPTEKLRHLLYPELQLDTYEKETAFLAVALVQTRRLRPALMPPALGQDFFLTGYRLFVRYRTPEGRLLRGLQVLRSDTDKPLMCALGNLMTHYHYHRAKISVARKAGALDISVDSGDGLADLKISANLDSAKLPEGSVFPDERTARRFAGPMPFTFSYEPETKSIVRIEGVRTNWHPRVVDARVEKVDFLKHLGLAGEARLANAFYLEDIPYRWERGQVAPVSLPPRRMLQGTTNIVKFNWPAYALSAGAVAVGTAVAANRRVPGPIRLLAGLGALGALYQAAASLTASHWIYDRSNLYLLDWLKTLWPEDPKFILNVHAGFDETSALLQQMYPLANLKVLDFFDPAANPEPSVARARRSHPPYAGTLLVGATGWPVADGEADALLIFLAAHEMRTPENRRKLFTEIRRVSAADGRIVIVEHLRNAANFAAFGPGAMHFLPERVWTTETQPWLTLRRTDEITPFLRVFTYQKRA
ncbi:hypothetical protein BH09VER1_BH09VER1_01410 [soil metagenome]